MGRYAPIPSLQDLQALRVTFMAQGGAIPLRKAAAGFRASGRSQDRRRCSRKVR